jgi:CRISPR/Cas system-associated protein Cas10 (large subunit of type III CRISPR-Cas system)
MPYLTIYRVVQCGATEYKGTTLGTTNQAFCYILLHLIEIEKWLKCLFYKGYEAKRRKWGMIIDNSTYPKGGVSCSKDSLVVNQTSVFQIKFCGKSPALRVAAKR